jgi:hypothetical protein
MLRLAKAFWDIALSRRSPADLPASLFLLCLVAVVSAALEVFDALLPPHPSRKIAIRVLLEVGWPILFAGVVLAAARRSPRFLQTASALVGVGILADLMVYPAEWMLEYIGTERLFSVPFYVLYFVGFTWFLLACSQIWRAALDSGLGVGAAISVGYLLLQLTLEQQFLAEP